MKILVDGLERGKCLCKSVALGSMIASGGGAAHRRLGKYGRCRLNFTLVVLTCIGLGLASCGGATSGNPTTTTLPTFPGNSNSYYVNPAANLTDLQNLGCSQDQLSNGLSSVGNQRQIILDFGDEVPDPSSLDQFGVALPPFGSVIWPDELSSNPGAMTVENAFNAFLMGWDDCSNISGVDLAIGIASGSLQYSRPTLDNTGGSVWGALVNNIKSTSAELGSSNRVFGAMDIETGFYPYSDVQPWVSGFESGGPGAVYWDFGDAGGCPPTVSGSNPNYVCESGWTVGEVYNVAHGDPGSSAVPEIYYSVNAQQWESIGVIMGTPISFTAVMSDYTACTTGGRICHPNFNTPTEAWTQLQSATGMSNFGSTDMSWE